MTLSKSLTMVLVCSAVFSPPSFANWFHNPRLGINLNVGSAPNPPPRPRIVEELPPPAPRLAYAAPAAPAPAERTFMVFFGFDRSDLTPEAEAIVREAALAAQREGAVRLVVTGHTDTVGSRAYNQRLSERRAFSVKTALSREGLDPRSIVTVGKNFSDPLVPTGPGIREPQNRRAVIDLTQIPIS